MRTAGQGQAAVPREREYRRRWGGLPGPCDLGRMENILRTVTNRGALSRGLRQTVGGIRFAMGALLRTMAFVLREIGVCAAPKKIWRE